MLSFLLSPTFEQQCGLCFSCLTFVCINTAEQTKCVFFSLLLLETKCLMGHQFLGASPKVKFVVSIFKQAGAELDQAGIKPCRASHSRCWVFVVS